MRDGRRRPVPSWLEKHRDLMQLSRVSDVDPTVLLNDRQKQCLRLVYANLEAKEIAIELGLSPHTVNEHLRDARRILGVSRSMQAARLLNEAEDPERSVSRPFGVEVGSVAVEQEVEPEIVASEAVVGGNRYRLSALQRLGIVVGLAIGIVVLGGALVGTTDLVARLLTKYRVDISDEPYKR
ncbi:LuxR C-terminal-related transcriptional regulator [Sphingomonas sp. 4RDLI-65]